MNDEQLEQALLNYQPRRPDPSLRSRVLGSAATPRVPLRRMDWALLAAAAVLLLTAMATAPRDQAAPPTPEEIAWRNEVVLVASTIDSEHALQIAEMLVPRRQPPSVLQPVASMEPAPLPEPTQ
jgi:hypothetical protein